MTPFTIRNRLTNESQAVPCGRCPSCVKRRVSQWSFRLMQEEKVSSSAHFITLTYDTKHSPITRAGYMSLNKRDIQLFFKRLRKTNLERLKYYAVGEYGGSTYRPHYHVILFNADISTIQTAWGLGHCHYGQVTGASVGYTLKYMSKRKRIPLHCNDDRLQEFALMSKGLGLSYITPQIYWWHHAAPTDRMFCNIEDGKKIAMSRYYKEKIYTDKERKFIGMCARQRMISQQLKEMQEKGELYYCEKAQGHMAAFVRMDYQSNQLSKI